MTEFLTRAPTAKALTKADHLLVYTSDTSFSLQSRI